jgi:hypothetical protein
MCALLPSLRFGATSRRERRVVGLVLWCKLWSLVPRISCCGWSRYAHALRGTQPRSRTGPSPPLRRGEGGAKAATAGPALGQHVVVSSAILKRRQD